MKLLRNYVYISDTSKVCVAVIILSLVFFPFATFGRGELGQTFTIDLHNDKVGRSTSGWITGDTSFSDDVTYLQIINTYAGKSPDNIPVYYLIPLYLNTKIPMFLDMWLILTICLGASLFMNRNVYVGVVGGIIVAYYAFIAYLMFDAVGVANQYTTMSSLITGIPVTIQENALGLKISDVYMFKLTYGWYLSVIAGLVLLKENLNI